MWTVDVTNKMMKSMWSSQLNAFNLSNWESKPQKNQAWQGFDPRPLRWADTMLYPIVLIKPTGEQAIVSLYYTRWWINEEGYVWYKSYVKCGSNIIIEICDPCS